jgi:hypothetical protein
MRKLKIITGMLVLLLFSVTSCVKKEGYLDIIDGKPSGLITIPSIGGLSNFPSAALLTSAGGTLNEAIPLYYNGADAPASDVAITTVIDDAKRIAYNATNAVKYDKMPDSVYSYTVKTGKIIAGTRRDSIDIKFFASKIDPTKNYMLPITITDASGIPVSDVFGTVYYHTIGNPIAGKYIWDFYRWNNGDGSGSPNAGTFFGDEAIFKPTSPTSIEVESGYFILPRYVITFTNNAGVLTNFAVDFNANDEADLNANGVTVTQRPKFLVVDPATGHYKIQYIVWNGAANRYLIDDYYKP